jgi:Domain of unknown function (DUF4932)
VRTPAALLALSAVVASSAHAQSLIVRPDARIELLSIVYHIAGAGVYNQARDSAYARDVDATFGRFRDHPVAQRARLLEDSLGIGYSDPMEFALHLSDATHPREVVPFDGLAHGRWPVAEARAFLADLQAFVRDAPVGAFLAAHGARYDSAATHFRRLADTTVDPRWFGRFFGHTPAKPFVLIPAILNGGANYGPSVQFPDGPQFYAIMGSDDVPTIIHEFSHSFVNPVVDRHRARFASAGPRVLDAVRQQMHSQAYDSWTTVIYESLVRASVARYRLAHEGRAAADAQVAEERAAGFVWMRELYDLLGAYEANRHRYPDLDAFAPQIAAYWSKLPARLPALIAQEDSLLTHVISTTVDPALATVTIRFDHPVRDSLNLRADRLDTTAHFPNLRGASTFDSTHTVLTVPVSLDPGQSYAIALGGRGALPRIVVHFTVKP